MLGRRVQLDLGDHGLHDRPIIPIFARPCRRALAPSLPGSWVPGNRPRNQRRAATVIRRGHVAHEPTSAFDEILWGINQIGQGRD